MRRTKVFLDTSYAIALSSTKDRHHLNAVSLADALVKDRTKLVTTRAVVIEIGNALGKQRHRQAAVTLLGSIEKDQMVDIIPITEELYKLGFELYKQRTDKEWGLTDCISFVAMRQRNLTEALTADSDFEQAGFKALLRGAM
jgi:predicted nucleic acid-binding protein